jgi:hypothetical protein
VSLVPAEAMVGDPGLVALRIRRETGQKVPARSPAGEKGPTVVPANSECCSECKKMSVDDKRGIWSCQDQSGIAPCAVDTIHKPGESISN